MNLIALSLLGLAVGAGEPANDVYPIKSRTLKLDIDYKPEQRQTIQQVQLCVSRDQGQTWEVADAVTPDKDHFVFNAKDDGIYWLNMVIVFRDGKKDPPDVTRVAPAQKLLVDATPPVVRITSAQRVGEEILLEWAVEDKFPNDIATQVQFKPTGANAIGDWQPISAANISKRSARFKPGTASPLMLQVTTSDLAGNPGTSAKEVAGTTTTTSYMPVNPAPVAKAIEGGLEMPTSGSPGVVSPPSGGIVVPQPIAVQPVVPTDPPVVVQPVVPQQLPPTPPVVPAQPPVVTQQPISSTPPTPAPAAWVPSGGAPTPSVPPTNYQQTPGPLPQDLGPQPIAVTGTNPPAPQPPAAESPSAQFIRFTRFDLQYQVENGPSGVSRIDLYVTRDDGRNWVKWSQHDGRETPLKVALDTRFNQQAEGDYGFRLVPVSGAGLTDGAPSAGTAPEMRVHVDVTAPTIKVFQPTADPNQRNTLVLNWEATDRNFGRDPIAIDYSENPTGPWKSVTSPDLVTPVAGGVQPVLQRLPNTGNYSWQLPATLATHKVYLKFTAWDAAGNRSEVVTPMPVMVDLTKPRARIQGISTGPTLPRP